MRAVAARLACRGFLLRSGAADGADSAFEQGCMDAGGMSEIWLPWPGFNSHADTGLYPSDGHIEMAKKLHPAWERLTRGPRSLHARNVGQILGADLNSPVDFVIAWTPDGCESVKERTRDTGGTGTAIALADELGIPVFNFAKPDARERLNQKVLEMLAGAERPCESFRAASV